MHYIFVQQGACATPVDLAARQQSRSDGVYLHFGTTVAMMHSEPAHVEHFKRKHEMTSDCPEISNRYGGGLIPSMLSLHLIVFAVKAS